MSLPALKTGDKQLDSCYQYAVLDIEEKKVLNIKVYGKLSELIGRDGSKLFGSKIKEIVGCKRQVCKHDQKFRIAKDNGMTRLEISFNFDTFTGYSFNQPSVKNQFQHYVSNLIEKLTN